MNKPEDPMPQPSEQDNNEARVLAMLLGESDPEEQAALETLLVYNAELRAYRERTAERLGLMEEATRGKAELETDPLRLDAERRAELEKLLAEEETQGEREGTVTPFEPIAETTETKSRQPVPFSPLVAAAAVVLLASIMIWSSSQEHDHETDMAYADEKTPKNNLGNDAQKEIGSNRVGDKSDFTEIEQDRETDLAFAGQQVPTENLDSDTQNEKLLARTRERLGDTSSRRSPDFKTKDISDIAMPSIASLEEKLAPVVAKRSSDILDKRVADEITAINEAPLLEAERPAKLLGYYSRGEFAANGFAFGGRIGGSGGGGGFALGKEIDPLSRDSSTQSGPKPPGAPAAQAKPKVFLATVEPAPPDPTEPAAEPAAFDDAPAFRPAPDSSVESISEEKSLIKGRKVAKDEKNEDEETARSNRRIAQLHEDNFDRDGALALNAGGISGASDPAVEGQELAFRSDNKDASATRLRDKAFEEAKKVPAKPTSGASAAPGKLEGNLVLRGSADASSSNDDDLEKDQREVRKASTHLDTDLASVPSPLPTLPQPEVSVAEKPVSSFALKVSDTSFALANASIKQGQWPEKAIVRSEDFVNAFDYPDPTPKKGESLAFRMERARHPFANDREVLWFSLDAATTVDEKKRPLNLVVALDNSDSMKRGNRLEIAKKTLHGLAKHLTDGDHVSLVTFARQPKLRLNYLTGDEFSKSIDEISQLGSEEETNLEQALDLAYAIARKRYLPKGSNRVLLLSDGGANLGERVPRALKAKVDEHRSHGIALDCIGLGAAGYEDHMLETISRKGRYFFLNNLSEADEGFGRKLAGTLRPVFTDLKVQVEFNPERVELYRQVGFKKDQLRKQYFDEKSIGGAEIANGEAGNMLYVVKVDPKGKGDLGVLRVRYKELKTGNQKQREWQLSHEREAPVFADASASMRLAVHAATFAEWLAENPYSAGFVIERSIGELQAISNDLPDKASIDRLHEMMIRSRAISR